MPAPLIAQVDGVVVRHCNLLQPREVPQQGSRWGSPPKREGWQFMVQASGLQKVRPQLPGCHILKGTPAFLYVWYVWYAMLSRGTCMSPCRCALRRI